MQVYRLEDSKNEFPKHWSYGDAWAIVDGEIQDNRRSGFQVWDSLSSVLAAAAGAEKDGYYSPEHGYEWFHSIEVSKISDGAGEWFSVLPENIEVIKTVKVSELLTWSQAQWKKDVNGEYPGYEDNFEEWVEDSIDDVSDWLSIHAETVSPVFVETLENPYSITTTI